MYFERIEGLVRSGFLAYAATYLLYMGGAVSGGRRPTAGLTVRASGRGGRRPVGAWVCVGLMLSAAVSLPPAGQICETPRMSGCARVDR